MQRITRVITINLGLIIGALVVAEIVFGNWIFGLNYSVLNVPRNETRYFDVSEFIKPDKVVVYTRDQHGLRGDYGSNPANIDIIQVDTFFQSCRIFNTLYYLRGIYTFFI